MGIYDRDYYRSERPGLYLSAPRTMVVYLILINAILWLVNGLITPPQPGLPGDLGTISNFLAVRAATLTQPWLWWQFVTYGFVHSPELWHILFNMLGLFFFGREVETLYGRKEFLRFYLATLVAGSVVWAVVNWFLGTRAPLCGASGAVVAVVVLFVLHFPRQTVYLYFIPMPAWVLGVILIGSDIYHWILTPESNVAYIVHLTGAAFALAYYYAHWNFGNWLPDLRALRRVQSAPKLRIHDPQLEQRRMSEEVDRILEKISREGEESLSRKERRTLENASREYQKRRRDGGD